MSWPRRRRVIARITDGYDPQLLVCAIQCPQQVGRARGAGVHDHYIDTHIELPDMRGSLSGIQGRHGLMAGLREQLTQPPNKTKILIYNQDNLTAQRPGHTYEAPRSVEG